MLDILMSRSNNQVHIDEINDSATEKKSKIGLQYSVITVIAVKNTAANPNIVFHRLTAMRKN